jgi:hypothetical protein
VWIEDGRWQRQSSGIADEPVPRYARARLRKRRRKLVKQGAGLAKLASSARHQIRIEAKKLRYMAEFVGDIPGVAKDRKRLQELIACCEKLQAALGAIRDEEAMVEFMENEVGVGADTANGLTKTAILPAGPPSRPKGGIEKEIQKAVGVDVPNFRALAVRHDERIIARIGRRDDERVAGKQFAGLGAGQIGLDVRRFHVQSTPR